MTRRAAAESSRRRAEQAFGAMGADLDSAARELDDVAAALDRAGARATMPTESKTHRAATLAERVDMLAAELRIARGTR